MLKSFFTLSLILLSLSAFSQEIDPALYINSVEIEEVPTAHIKMEKILEAPRGGVLTDIAMYVDGILAIGKKIWPIIEAGRPVITTTGIAPAISVLPFAQDNIPSQPSLMEMANWSAPKAASYKVTYKNLYGGTVISFTYTIYFQYNGSYKGKGKYLTSLKVQASEIYASWGFNFDASSELMSIANVGTDEDRVASAIIQISYKSKGILNSMNNAHSIYVDGNGVIKSLNN